MSILADELLRVEHLCKYFPIKGIRGPGVQAVRDVSFTIMRGETLGLVGESGCGKTTLGRTILRLYEPTSGKIFYNGSLVFSKNPNANHPQTKAAVDVDMVQYRRKVQIIFQDPSSSLDPRMTVGEAIGEAIDIHRLASSRSDRASRISSLLELVGLRPEDARRYPHALSGGQQQRVGIARALAVEPEFLVCDEPVSALDVSIQAQIVNLLEDMQQEFGLTYLFIAHDLSVVRHISKRIGVMYLGSLVELAESHELVRNPLHPYTVALLSSVPVPDPRRRTATRTAIKGEIPSPILPTSGCPFHPRCPKASPECRSAIPPLREVSPGHFTACYRSK